MKKMEEKHLWYPYAQMKTRKEDYKVVSAEGMYLKVYNTEKDETRDLIDAVSSWWCAAHGYNNKEINTAIAEQMSKFSHVMLGGLTHDPALKLAEKLVEITPEGLNHVFFSDSGSVGVEVALKMAIQYYSNKGNRRKLKFISLNHSYHGDTFKTMEIGDDPDYHHAFSPLFKNAYHVTAPKNSPDAELKDIEKELEELEKVMKEHHEEVAAFIVEPLLQAGGGFNFYTPKYLEKARELCDKYDILFIFDEVATGFGRTGKMFAADHCNINPDILILGKALTGGYLGHAATLATTKVFEAFYGDDPEMAFMHGPTFMGNALTCAAALKSIEIYERENYLNKIEKIEKKLKEEIKKVNSDKIADKRVFGVTAVVEVKDSVNLKGFQEFAYERGVWIRPFLNCIYTMPPYVISEEEIEKVIGVIKEWFDK